MKKDEIQDVIIGIAVVALGYALYTKFKGGSVSQYAAAAPGGQYAGVPTNPTYGAGFGAPYNPETVAGSMGLAGLLAGTVTDIGAYNGVNYVAGMTDTAVAGVGRDSIYVAGGYW